MATLASDNFNRADSDTLGTGWTEAYGDFDVASNKASLAGHTGDAHGRDFATWDTALGASPAADYDVEAIVRITTTGQAGVAGRYTDVENFYRLRVDTVSQNIRLTKTVGNTSTTLGTYSGGQSVDTDYTVKLSMVGTAIKGYQDTVERISVTDSGLTATGKPALFGDSIGKTWDNFAVYGTAAGSASLSPSATPSPSLSKSLSPSSSVSPSLSKSLSASLSKSLSSSLSKSLSPSASISQSLSQSLSPSTSAGISEQDAIFFGTNF